VLLIQELVEDLSDKSLLLTLTEVVLQSILLELGDFFNILKEILIHISATT
jgi:hypothetical protein